MADPTRAALIAYAQRMALKYGVDPDIFVAQINQESGFNPQAHNPSGATGIAQLMPQYYKNAGQDPYADLEAAAQTMGNNVKRYNGDYSKALAAYNAGAGNVDKYGGVPPFEETQRYVSTILGGDRTMGVNQDSQAPGVDINALVEQAINGDTSQVVPDGSVGTAASNTPAGANGTSDGNSVLQMVIGTKGDPIRVETLNPTVKQSGGVFGPTSVPNQEPTYRYWFKDGTYLDGASLNTGLVVKGGTALRALAAGTSPKVQTFPDGSLREENPDAPIGSPNRWVVIASAPTTAAPKTVNTKRGTFQYDGGQWSLVPGTEPPGSNVQIHTMPDGSLQQYDPDTGQWTVIQERYTDPTESAYKQALTAEAQARTSQIQQQLRPVAQKAIEDAWATIAAVQQQIASGKMTPTEGNALMAEVHQGLSATLAGTTLFEQKKQAEDTQTQRAQTASSLLSQRVSSASSLGQSLFNAASHVYLPAGKSSLGLDPLAIANQEVNTMGGDQQLGDAASAFLSGAFGKAGLPGATSPAAAAGQPSFPTTREAVLAMYPHLGGQTAQAAPPAPPQPQPAMAGS